MISNVLNSYCFIIPIFITKLISFYTFIITLCITGYKFVKTMQVYTLTVAAISFLTVYTIAKTKQTLYHINTQSEKLANLLEQNKTVKKLLKHPNMQKVLFVINYIKYHLYITFTYIKYQRDCGLQNLNDRLVYTFIHKGKVTRIPIQFNGFIIQNVTLVQYMLHGKNSYESLKDHVDYINSFIDNKYKNIIVTPGLMGYKQIKLNIINEEFEVVEKEYFVNDIIN